MPDGTVVTNVPDDVTKKQLLQLRKQHSKDVPDIELLNIMPETPPKSMGEKFVRDIPAMAGGILGPLIASKAGPLARIGAAALGGTVGEAAVTGTDILRQSADAPTTTSKAVWRTLEAGGEQALFEGISQVVMKGMQALTTRGYKNIPENYKLKLAGKFREYGGNFTLAEATDSWLAKQADAISRGSLTASGTFKARDLLNESAYKSMTDDLPNLVADRAKAGLSSDDIGNMFINTIRSGKAAHSAIGGELYRAVDSIAANKGAVVNLAPIKRYIEEKMTKEAAIGNMGLTAEEKDIMNIIPNLSDTQSFAVMHDLRSRILSVQRDLVNTDKARAKQFLGVVSDLLTNSMDKAATESGGELATAYAKASRFWRKGKETFNNRFIANLLKDTTAAEDIGKKIFKMEGTSNIYKAKKAVKTAAVLDKGIDGQKVWHSMQTGFIEDLLTKNMSADGIVNSKNILKLFERKRSQETLKASFTKEQRDAIYDFAQIGNVLQSRPDTGLKMIMQLSQGGAVIRLLTAGKVAAAEASTLFLGPKVIAKAMTNPRLTRFMSRMLTTKVDTTAGKQLVTKIPQEFYKLIEEDQQAGNK